MAMYTVFARCDRCMDMDYLNEDGLCRWCVTGEDPNLDEVTAMELFWGKDE